MSEIIIDGVKVEECSYYNKDNTPYCCEVWDNECEAQLCYFKQLKRLQEENERLKHLEKSYNDLVNRVCLENYERLEQENAEYKQALEEIMEINKEFFDMNYGFDEQGISYDVKEVAREIQDKTNEVLK